MEALPACAPTGGSGGGSGGAAGSNGTGNGTTGASGPAPAGPAKGGCSGASCVEAKGGKPKVSAETVRADNGRVAVAVAAATKGARVSWTLPSTSYAVGGVQLWRAGDGLRLVAEFAAGSDPFADGSFLDESGDAGGSYVVTLYAQGGVGRYQGSEAPAFKPSGDAAGKAKDAPMPPVGFAVAALAGLAIALRRRATKPF